MGRRISLVLLVVVTIFGGFCLKSLAENPRATGKWQRFGPGTSECPICRTALSYWNDPVSTLNRKVEITANEIKISYTTRDSFRIPEAEILCEATWKIWKNFERSNSEDSAARLCPVCSKTWRLIKSGATITSRRIDWGCVATVAFVEDRKTHSEISASKAIDSLPEKTSIFDTMYKATSPIQRTVSNSVLNFPGAKKAEIVGTAPPISRPLVRDEGKQPDTIPPLLDEVPTDQDIDQKPTLIRKTEPNYPPIAYANRIEGRVVLSLLLETDGRVLDVKVLKSSNEIFNEDAIGCAKQWTFKPAMFKGNPIKFWYTDSLDFKIK